MLTIKRINPTLQRLLNTTEQLVREKGCKKTTLKEIMVRSGISKGGIYHYVESKTELLSFVLRARVEQIHQKFIHKMMYEEQSVADGIQMLLQYLYQLNPQSDVLVHQILIYLLNKRDDLAARQAIRAYYRQVLQTTVQWIEQEQQLGRFSERIDREKIADLFVLISLGIQIREGIPSEAGFFSTTDFYKFVYGVVKK